MVPGVVLCVVLVGTATSSLAMDVPALFGDDPQRPPRRSSAVTLPTSPVRAIGALTEALSSSTFDEAQKRKLHSTFILDAFTQTRAIDRTQLSPDVMHSFISLAAESLHRFVIGDMLFRLAARARQHESLNVLLDAGYIALPKSSIPGDDTNGVLFLQWVMRERRDMARSIVAIMRSLGSFYSEVEIKEVAAYMDSFGEGREKRPSVIDAKFAFRGEKETHRSVMAVVKPQSRRGLCTIL